VRLLVPDHVAATVTDAALDLDRWDGDDAARPPAAVEQRLRERADAMLAAARERFDGGERLDPVTWPAPPQGDDAYPDSVAAAVDRAGGIGGVAPVDDRGRLLCVDVAYKEPDWQTPGGAVDPGETLAETAVREAREETGVAVEPTGLVYSRLVEYAYDDAVVPIPMAVFRGRAVGGELADDPGGTLPDGREEIADARWFPGDELPAGLLDRAWHVEWVSRDESTRDSDQSGP